MMIDLERPETIAGQESAVACTGTDALWREFQDAVGRADQMPLAYRAQIALVRAAGARFTAAFHVDQATGASH